MRNEKTDTNDLTVQELIEELMKLPQEMSVVTTGYESGYDFILRPKIIKVVKIEDPYWWDGKFQNAETEVQSSVDMVLLAREDR
ncbi:MAG: hypothetical protein NTX05_01225 [Fusobacteria bacterium]|nr:hypothetical protein [Fusobacteriota bacterium]